MTCPVCGTYNAKNCAACANCGASLGVETSAVRQEKASLAARPLVTASSQGTATQLAQAAVKQIEPGQMLGSRYRIESEAGHGGMGRVYRATDLELHRTVALKVIRSELADDAVTVARLKEEIRLASEISHPHVLRIHDLGEAGGARFISMAWVDGEDLAHLIARCGRMDERAILRIAEQVCEGLEAAHGKRIIHRDLKPQNILIDANGSACISDFGLAQSAAQEASAHLTQTGHVVGTPRYMSPEQLGGNLVDHRTDIYSVGLVLYEMATGETPDLRKRLFQAPPSPKLANPAISEKLARIILRCLETDPGKRYSTARELLQDLRAEPVAGKVNAVRWTRFGYALAAIVFIAVAIALVLARRPAGIPPLGKGKYIAVLPLVVEGSDASLQSYSQGITEAVAARLFTLEAVHPISQAAVERANLKAPLESIAQEVGANIIAEGKIENRGGAIAVHSRIISIEPRKILSEETFTGDSNSLLDIENGIYEQIAGAAGARATEKQTFASATAHPTHDAQAYDLYLKGRELLKEKRDADGASSALHSFEQACAKDPTFALAWTGVADASLLTYRAKRDSFWAAKALDAARRAASYAGDLPEVHFTLGSVYTATGKNAEAVQELKRALELEPNSDNGYIRLGRAYLATGQTDAALRALNKAVELNPYYWYNHDQLGLAFFRMGRNNDALKEFKAAASLDPNNAMEYNRIGATYWRLARLQDSIEQFKKVIKLQPSADAYTNLGTAYFALERYREAIPNFKKAAQINNKHVLYIANLADAYRQAGQNQDAARTYGDAITLAYQQLQINPQDAATMGILAMCYAKQGDTEKAAAFVQRARGIDPADNQLMYDEAVIQALSGKTQEALLALQHALENGYSVEEAKRDVDLNMLRTLPAFRNLVAEFSGRSEPGR